MSSRDGMHHSRVLETLQRRLKHERKSRRRLQLQLQRCTGANLSPPSEARSHYSYSSCSAGGSTDSDDAQPRIQSLQQEPAERSSFAEHGKHCFPTVTKIMLK